MNQPPIARCNDPKGYTTHFLAGEKDFPLDKAMLNSDDYTLSQLQRAQAGWKTFIYEIRTVTSAEPTQIAQGSPVQDACESGIEHLRNRTSHFSGGVHISFARELEQESKITRGIVYQILRPASEYISAHPETLPVMADQMLQCVHDLRYEALVLHRDVSEGNILFTLCDDGKPHFILHDFDLAFRVNDGRLKGNTSTHRTGTVPYMAVDLVQSLDDAKKAMAKGVTPKGISHCVRFDYESVFWVSLGFGIKLLPANTPDRKRQEQERYELYPAAWMKEHAWSKKLAILQGTTLISTLNNLSKPFENLKVWFMAFQKVFGEGIVKSTNWSNNQGMLAALGLETAEKSFADHETHFDCVTLETIRAALNLTKSGVHPQVALS